MKGGSEMRTLLLGLGAMSVLLAAPAAAQPVGSSAQTSSHNGHGDGANWGDRNGRFRRGADVLAVTNWYGGEWAAYNNRGWQSDSYNDWWHDRPDRAFPRWVQHNQDCQRVWWGGGGWRC